MDIISSLFVFVLWNAVDNGFEFSEDSEEGILSLRLFFFCSLHNSLASSTIGVISLDNVIVVT
jgi:hypothetical protein